MYGKIVNNRVQYAPKDLVTETEYILNFNQKPELMIEKGYREVVDNRPNYNQGYQEIEYIGPKYKGDKISIEYTVKDKDIEVLRTQQIEKSKTSLSDFLLTHPLYSTAKYADGRYYTVTAEKQQQLTSKLLVATAYSQVGLPYTITWNDTGLVCEPWTMEQLTQLSLEIDGYVTPLVKHQQVMEVQIKECKTSKDVYEFNIEYDSVLAAMMQQQMAQQEATSSEEVQLEEDEDSKVTNDPSDIIK